MSVPADDLIIIPRELLAERPLIGPVVFAMHLHGPRVWKSQPRFSPDNKVGQFRPALTSHSGLAHYIGVVRATDYGDKLLRAIKRNGPRGQYPAAPPEAAAFALFLTGPNQDRRVLKSVVFARAE